MKETTLFHLSTKLVDKSKSLKKISNTKVFLFCAFLGFFTIGSACASASETSEIQKPSPPVTTTTTSVSSTTVDVSTTTSTTVFFIPSEGENFEAVVDLCDLASNSLQCEEDCFADDSNLKECVAEAKEIANSQKIENDTKSDPIATSSTSSSVITENNEIPDQEKETNSSTKTEDTPTFLGSYTFSDSQFGTQVTVSVSESVRSIKSNALPNHETGNFPNPGNPNSISEQDTTYEFTTEPVYADSPTEVLTTGVAINGIKFEPGTAESVSCTSGEFYRIEALQETYNLGLDLNNAHVQPTGEYHYHGVSQLLADAFSSDMDLIHMGFAADGFLIHYSKSGVYESGYVLKNTPRTGTGCVATGPAGGTTVSIDGTVPDGTYTSDWIHVNSDTKLDTCNGTIINEEYTYLMTDTFPYIPRCLNGQVSASRPTGGSSPGLPRPGGAMPPDLTSVAEALGVDLSDLMSALGPPPPDLEAAALKLKIPLSELQSLIPGPG